MTFNFWVVRSEFLFVKFNLKCYSVWTSSETIHDPYYLFLSPSENFQLHEVLPEVLPEVPPVVLLDGHLKVHFEVLTSSEYTWVIPTHPKSNWLYLDPIKAKKKFVCGGWVVGGNQK